MSFPEPAGKYYFTKTCHRDLLMNHAFTSLPPDVTGIYFRLRLLAGATQNHGSMEMGSTRKMTRDDVVEYMVSSCQVPNRRKAGEILERLVDRAGLLKVSKAGVVTIANWEMEQASAAPAALRKRKQAARDGVIRYMVVHGLDPMEAKREAWKLVDDPRVEQLLTMNVARRRILDLCDPIIAAYGRARGEGLRKAPAGPSVPSPQGSVSGFDSGCEPSRLEGVRTHTETDLKTDTEERDEVSLNRRPDPDLRRDPPAEASGSAHDVQRGEGTEGPAGCRGAVPVFDARDPDALRRMDPIEAACVLTKEHGELARNTYRKRLRELQEAYGAQGLPMYWDCLFELAAALRENAVRKTPSAFLNGIFRRRIDGAAGAVS